MELIEKIKLLSPEHREQVERWISAYFKPLYEEKAAYDAEDVRRILSHFPPDKPWTAAELDDTDIFPPNLTVKVELVDYTLHIMPDPTAYHQEILTNVVTYLNLFVRKYKLGKAYVAPFSLHINEGNVRKPDMVLVLSHKVERVTERGIYEAPDLVVEFISPANYKKLRQEQKAAYAAFGVAEYWEIYPDQQEVRVEVLEKEGEVPLYRTFSVASSEGNNAVCSKLLAGFSLGLEEVFSA